MCIVIIIMYMWEIGDVELGKVGVFVVYVLRQVEMVRGRRQGNYWKRVCRNCFTLLLITSVWAIMPTLVILPSSYLVRSRLVVWMISRALFSLALTFSRMKMVSEMVPCWIRCWIILMPPWVGVMDWVCNGSMVTVFRSCDF